MNLLLLTLAFVISGAAGLIYESTWARYLGLFVGHDAYAQALVLVIFMGGMSAGAWYGGKLGTRLRASLMGYAVVEAVAGLLGLAFHPVFVAMSDWAYTVLLPPLTGGILLGPAKWILSALLLLPQSLLLGASFPLMAAGVLQLAPETPGRRLAQLYFANSLGAAAGVLIGGFYLVPRGGLPGAIQVAAGANLFVAGLVALVAIRLRGAAVPAPRVEAASAPVAAGDRTRTLLLAVSAGTAIASFLYEIDWIRMLSLVLGSATHAFELMLSAFILGLALGAFWIRGRADSFRRPFRALGAIQVAMGLAALGTLFAYAHSFAWMSWLLGALAKTGAGYQGFTVARYAIAVAIMLPATCFAGMTLPLITRLLLVRGGSTADIGTAYAWNTLGSIVGVVAGSLLLLPWLGVKGMLVVAGGVDILLGIALIASDRGDHLGRPTPRTLVTGALALVVVAVVTAAAVRLDPLALASGVYRNGEILAPLDHEVLFYADGRTASVSVVRAKRTGNVFLSTNGKPDASVTPPRWTLACPEAIGPSSLDGDVSTQILLPLVTLAHRPGAGRAAVVGFGSGMSTHMLLGTPTLASVTTYEIEPEMVEAARTIYPVNARAYDDRRARIVYADARTQFATGGAQYDLIMSEPSNPWVSGVSGLFTTEFYSQVKGALAPGGVFGQWLHAYELDDDLVLTVLAALHRTFGDYAVYQVGEGDFLIVATAEDRLPAPDWGVFDAPGLADLRCRTFPVSAATMRTLRVGGRALFAPLLDREPAPNSDFHPVLDLGAERRRFLGSRANGLEAITGDWRGRAAALEGAAPNFPDTVPAPAYVAVAGLTGRTAASAFARVDRALPAGSALLAEDIVVRDQWKAWRFRLTGPAPAPGVNFLGAFDALSALAHRGTAGYANPELFASANAFLARHRAPAEIRMALEFRRALLAWDFTTVGLTGTALLPVIKSGEGLVPRETYVDGMVIAAVRLGQPALADVVLSQVGEARPGSVNDLRDALLLAHMQRAFRVPR